MVGGLGNIPFVLGSVRYGLQLLRDLQGKIGPLESVPEFLIVINAIDLLALVFHLHQEIGIVIWLLCVELQFLGLVEMKFFVDLFRYFLFLDAFPEDPHFLG